MFIEKNLFMNSIFLKKINALSRGTLYNLVIGYVWQFLIKYMSKYVFKMKKNLIFNFVLKNKSIHSFGEDILKQLNIQ